MKQLLRPLALFLALLLLFFLAACKQVEQDPEPDPDPPEIVEPEPEPEPLSYEEYFSEERSFIDELHSNEDFFVYDEDKKTLYCEDGYGKKLAVIASQLDQYAETKGSFIAVRGSVSFLLGLDGAITNILYEGQVPLSHMSANSERIFFVEGTTVKRIQRASGVVDTLHRIDGIKGLIPLSNWRFVYILFDGSDLVHGKEYSAEAINRCYLWYEYHTLDGTTSKFISPEPSHPSSTYPNNNQRKSHPLGTD